MAKGARGYARFAEQMAVFCTESPSNRGHCNGEGVPQELENSAVKFHRKACDKPGWSTCPGLKLAGSYPTTNLSSGGGKRNLYSLLEPE